MEVSDKIASLGLATEVLRDCRLNRSVSTEDYKTFYIKAYKHEIPVLVKKMSKLMYIKNIDPKIDFDGWCKIYFEVEKNL